MQIPYPYKIKEEQLESLLKESEEKIHKLSKTVLDGLKPPSGAYAFFNHTSHALSRVKDIGEIIHRLYGEVRTLAALSVEENKSIPKEWPTGMPYSESVQALMKRSSELSNLAQLDMESLYIFGQILLDQWSLLAIAVDNVPLKKIHPFVELLNYFETNPKTSLKIIWEEHKSQMLWLHYQVRFYRNRFIIHANRPWQRGTTRSSYGEEYCLFTPTPPGWLDDKKLDEEIKSLLPLTPSRIRDAADDYWEKASSGRIIEILFNNIGNISENETREKIVELFGKKGGSTPTFQIIAKNLLDFISKATEKLNDIAKENLSKVDLGRPNKTSEEMWE